MFVLLSILIFFTSLSQLICVYATTQHVERRQAHNGPRSMIKTSMRSSNGTNVTSNFQTKIYVQPRIVPLNGLTNRGIFGERAMTTCAASSAEFHHSHCRHREGNTGSLREYLIWCRDNRPTTSSLPRPFPAATTAMAVVEPTEDDPSLYAELGSCSKDEICVDSLHAVTYTSDFVLTANCVNIKHFKNQLSPEDLAEDEDEDQDRGGEGSAFDLAGKIASIVVSQDDNQTPLKVQGMDLSLYDISESGSSSGLGSADDAAILQEKNCTDCFEMRTAKAFPKQVDDLELELTLVGAGSAALTGVLWVALMTG